MHFENALRASEQERPDCFQSVLFGNSPDISSPSRVDFERKHRRKWNAAREEAKMKKIDPSRPSGVSADGALPREKTIDSSTKTCNDPLCFATRFAAKDAALQWGVRCRSRGQMMRKDKSGLVD